MIQQGESTARIIMQVPIPTTDPIKHLNRILTSILPIICKGFNYRIEVDDLNSSVSVYIEKCLFKDFYRRNQMNFLCKPACSWYFSWMQFVDTEKHRLRFSRKKCMCQGDEYCCYEFRRMDKLDEFSLCPN